MIREILKRDLVVFILVWGVLLVAFACSFSTITSGETTESQFRRTFDIFMDLLKSTFTGDIGISEDQNIDLNTTDRDVVIFVFVLEVL